MTPYYDEDGITIYHADCLDIADVWLCGDVLVTDPPYGTESGAGYGRRAGVGWIDPVRAEKEGRTSRDGVQIAGDTDTTTRDKALTLWGSRPAAVFGSPRRPDPPGEWADRLVWDKKRPGINGGPWRYRHETIYVTAGFERVSDAAVSIIEAWPADQTLHIHAKPVTVMLRIVEAAPGGVIVDPFAGSGSTLVAAQQLGRKAIGIEIEERYCEIAVQRLAQGVLDFA